MVTTIVLRVSLHDLACYLAESSKFAIKIYEWYIMINHLSKAVEDIKSSRMGGV